MDNGGITSDDPTYLRWACEQYGSIFETYKFKVQLATNHKELEETI